MRKMSMATRKELIEALGARYRACDRSSKGKVLDEFVAVTGFHRKHAMRVLRQEALDRTPGRVGRRIYDEAVRTFFDADLVWKQNRSENEDAAS